MRAKNSSETLPGREVSKVPVERARAYNLTQHLLELIKCQKNYTSYKYEIAF